MVTGTVVLVGIAVGGTLVAGRLVGGTGVLVAVGVSVSVGVGVLVGVGVALGGVVAVGKESTRVVTGAYAATGVPFGAPRGVANAKKSVPPMIRHPNRIMPTPSSIGRIVVMVRSFSMGFSYKISGN